MFDFLFDATERLRKRRLRRAPEGPLKNYLASTPPKKKSFIQSTPILSVDFETTGLDPESHQILSIGYVEINHLGIQLSTANHQIIRIANILDPHNVVFHKITDKEKDNGIPLETGIENLLRHLQGRVLLAHHAKTELGFINKSCMSLYGVKPTIPVIDTIALAAKRLRKGPRPMSANKLRLFNLRHDFGLPEYPAHNALYDAISTAELFLAEINQLSNKHKTRLSEIVSIK